MRLHAEAPQLDLQPHWNITPGTMQPVVFESGNIRQAQLMKWNFVPPYESPYQPNCAKSETITTTAMFRDAFRERRCVVGMSGFYEWYRPPNEHKQPYYITQTSTPIIRAAAIWSDAGDVPTFAIVTTSPNEPMSAVHDRMPIFLHDEHVDQWLSNAPLDAKTWRRWRNPEYTTDLHLHPVSTRINSNKPNDESLVVPTQPVRQKGLFG